MNFNELDQFRLSDTVKYHNRLNRRLWGSNEHLLPDVRDKLLEIAEDFREFLGVDDLRVQDITLSGSNAAYNYTDRSDIDLHLIVDMPNDPVYQELFNAKKYQYNDEHNLTIGGADVELYVQPADQPHVSQGIYSVKDGKWIQVPRRRRAQIDDSCVRDKAADLDARIHAAVESGNADMMSTLWNKIKAMRQIGLEQHGEFGCENITFKLLRDQGCIRLLKDAHVAAQDHAMSLVEKNREKGRVTYGFGHRIAEDVTITPDGVSATTRMFLSEKGDEDNQAVNDFIQHVVKELGIDPAPEIVIHTDPEWSEGNHSFGRYEPESNTLNVSLVDRHILDVFRTIAHELVHCDQHQKQGGLPLDAGETGSEYENDANARAGIIMRDFAASHPEYFAAESLGEGASGYIPKNKREAAMPQYAMALSVDVHPGQTGKEANKMALQTGPNGEPKLLMKNLRNALREFKETGTVLSEQDLFEINMGSKNLRREAAKTGANAGMEFEMIVPDDVAGGSNDFDYDQEPDFDEDQRAYSPSDISEFFNDREYNSSRDVDRLQERMLDDYGSWQVERFDTRWDSDAETFIYDYLKENVDEDSIRELFGLEPEDDLGKKEYQLAADKIATEQLEPFYSDALELSREEYYENDNFEEWLAEEELRTMSEIYRRYDGIINWPHYTSSAAAGGSSLADDFSKVVGRPVEVSNRYHSGDQKRPGYDDFYLIEPDGSLDANNYQIVGQDGETYKLLWSEEPLVPDKKDDENLRKKISDQAKKTLNQWQSHASKNPEFVNQNYQIAKYSGNETPLEFVSPYMPIDKMLAVLNKVTDWAKKNKCTTNSSTGLHINVDVPNYSQNRLDFVKLALLMGDEYVLEQFGRLGNTYAKSAMGKVRDHVRQRPFEAKYLLDKMKGHMGALASKAIHSGSTDKYTSINTKNGHIEFRSPGGDWLDENLDKIENTLLRFTVALSAAMDPTAYREEYLKKLYKVLNPQNLQDTYGEMIQEFANYMAALQKGGADTGGVLSKETQQAVKSFRQAATQELKQKNIDKKLKKDIENSKNMALWKVIGSSNLPTQAQGITVKARNELEAFDQAAKEWNLNPELREKDYYEFNGWTAEKIDPAQSAGASTTASHPEGRGRPNDPNGQLAIVRRDDPRVYGYGSGTSGPAPDYLFRFTLGDGYSQAQLRAVKAAWAARENKNADDYIIVDTTMFADPVQTAAPAGSGSVQWNIVADDGDVVHTFWNRNVQADANAAALEWVQANWRPPLNMAARGPFEVVPVPAEVPAYAQTQTYEIYDREDSSPVETFTADGDIAAMARLNNYRQNGSHGLDPTRAHGAFGVRRAPIAGSTMDLQRQRMAAASMASQTRPTPIPGVQDIEPDVAQYTSQSAAPTQWEVYRRSDGVSMFPLDAATQAEAWAEGREWVQQTSNDTGIILNPADYSVRQAQ